MANRDQHIKAVQNALNNRIKIKRNEGAPRCGISLEDDGNPYMWIALEEVHTKPCNADYDLLFDKKCIDNEVDCLINELKEFVCEEIGL